MEIQLENADFEKDDEVLELAVVKDFSVYQWLILDGVHFSYGFSNVTFAE